MKFIYVPFAPFCFFFLSLSCAPSLKTQVNYAQSSVQFQAPICPEKNATLLIMPIADGVERKDGPALGSGKAMAAAFRSKLMQNGYNAIISDFTTLIENLENAKRYTADFIIRVEITEWEDNATNWSGKADRVNITVEIYKAENSKLEFSLSQASKSQWATLVDNSPDRLIPLIVDETLARIFCNIR